MADTFTTSLRIRKPEVGANENTWGALLNAGVIDMIDEAVAGIVSISVTGSNVTLTTVNGNNDQARNALLIFTGTPGAVRTITCPDVEKIYFVINNADTAVSLAAGGGTSAAVGPGSWAIVYTDGATNAVRLTTPYLNGIRFPATQEASSNANTLDDYEEGAFTPTFTATGVSGVTYAVQSGKYVKIGSLVTFKMRVLLTSKGSGGSGSIVLGGFPFTSASDFVSAMPLGYDFITLSAGYSQAAAYMDSGATGIGIIEQGDNVAAASVAWGAIANNSDFQVISHYYV